LRARLTQARVFDHRELASWLKLTLMLGVVGAALAGVVALPWWASLVLIPIAAVAAATAAMLGHEGSHHSFSTSNARNAVLAHIAFPLFSGLGVLYWRHKHNGLHHGHPNVVGGDPDIDLWPMASCRADYEASGPARRWFQRNLQGFAFWPLTTMLPVVMHLPSIGFVIGDIRKRGLTGANTADALCQLAHYMMWLVVPSLIWGPVAALAVYGALWAIVGVLLALVFAPARVGLPVTSDQYLD
jgi:linoleoyl-CoA desaturase